MSAERQLLVDLSVLVQSDDKSGIQRVVRNVLHALQEQPPEGYAVRAVRDAKNPHDGSHHYAYVDGGAPIAVQSGDIFLGLDLAPLQVMRNEAVFADLRRHGVRIYFAIYDLLPIMLPELFLSGARGTYSSWLAAASRAADGLVCISRAVADDVLAWQDANPVVHPGALKVGYFHLGANLQAAAPTSGIGAQEQAVIEGLKQRPALLMVGTLEPRKMQAQALDAFELLWQRGVEAGLVIVGKPGWMQDALAERLRNHPEQGKRLHWLESASDEALLRLYQGSAALLAASVGEGFGLPLIEAAAHGLPVIARDLPVFREVGGEHAFYFSGANSLRLAADIEQWLDLYAAGKAPASDGMLRLSWADSTRQLLEVILGQRWYREATTRLPSIPSAS
jgi:glycosyltransferase involved in cell wall biosynthesis